LFIINLWTFQVFFFPTGFPIKTVNIFIPHACRMPQSCPFHVIT
jgi:hypothetical protein